MPLFGHRKKHIDRSDSWSLGKSGLKSHKDSKNDLVFGEPVKEKPAPSLELPATNARPQSHGQLSRPPLGSTESTKSFAVELDGSATSSLPPSHRDGGSTSGSEATRGPSTTATSYTSSAPADRLTQELLAPDFGEKQVSVSQRPMPILTKTASGNPMSPETNKEVYIPSRTESSIFSTTMSTTTMTSRVYREYNYYNTSTFKDLVICDPSQKAVLYAEASSHTRSKSDVELREFSGEHIIPGTKSMSLKEEDLANTRIVAVADYVPDENASQIKLAIGDPLDPASNLWVVMKNVFRDAVSGAETYDMVVPGQGGSKVVFQWIKAGTQDHSDARDESSDAKEAYKLVSENGVIASFRNTSMTNVRKRGSLRVYEGPMVDQYLLLIFLSASAMSEMYRRRRCKKIRRSFLVPF